MTREEIYSACLDAIGKSNCLLLEAATGTGKTFQSIKLVNHLSAQEGKKLKVLLLVAKRVHKVTWKEEFEKWGGVNAEVTMECYESLRKHIKEDFDCVLADEVHHIQSKVRLDLLSMIRFKYFIGLSATIPRNLKSWFKWKYKAQIVSCDILEAIEDDVLPEPEILLFPLQLDNKVPSEEWEINQKSAGPIARGNYTELWKYKKNKQHAILKCTQKQKSNELNAECLWFKNKFNMTRNEGLKNIWLQKCGQRLEFYANCKLYLLKLIVEHLKKYRTITFCKTIAQAEAVGKWCIHSKNGLANKYYEAFNKNEIHHITAVNILNENANLVDCKYAIFGNLSSSEIIQVQRCGRALRHKHPVIIVPYYEGTREEEVVEDMFKDYDKSFIRVIHTISEIK